MIKKIAIVGGESTGKSTLSVRLATELNCLWVPEFARLYLDQTGPAYTETEVEMMAYGQLALEQAILCQAKGNTIVCDTNLLVFFVWMEHVYHNIPLWLIRHLEQYNYQTTLLCAPTLPWEPDPLRENPELRDYFFERYEQVMESFGIDYQIVDPRTFSARDLA